ncbi:MAG: carbon-nitrogen hydrolase family protein [Clostridiales bacterium]|nr:carbon-nitrogen hydrolase family protein [Clostridiales bacterium]
MNIVTVTDKSIMDEIYDYQSMLNEGDILIAGFGTTDDFNYISEFAGKTENLKKFVKFSKDKRIIFIAATVSRLLGKYYNTAIVIHKGNILGVSDQTHKTRSELTLGNNLKLYETDEGNIGILIGEDIFFPECAMALALGGADRIIYLSASEYGKDADIMLKASAIFCGMSIVAVFADFTIEYTNRGARNIIESEDLLIFESTVKKNDLYIKNRRQIVYENIVVTRQVGE